MIRLTSAPVILTDGQRVKTLPDVQAETGLGIESLKALRNHTIAYQILRAHDSSEIPGKLRIRFDSITSHDITYVGIIQSAIASGLDRFPIPYVLTNCHNSLCAVGGTINADDHAFGLSAARRFGGVYVPPNLAVIHQFEREMMSGCGRMILGSDSHTRYGALGTMAIGEGGPELVKQLLANTYDIDDPEVVLVYLTGAPRHGVGPQDVALALIQAVFPQGFVKNRVLEFAGPGISSLSIDFRNGIDVMTTETTCLSSVWATDGSVRDYFALHGRPDAYRPLRPGARSFYDRLVEIELSEIEPMIALPFHPSNALPIRELLENPGDHLRAVEIESEALYGAERGLKLTDKVINGKIRIDQGEIAGCAGGMYENICAAADIIETGSIGDGFFELSVYPSSLPVYAALAKNQVVYRLQAAGVVTKSAFCGPCFGAGDIGANHSLSIRHTTRNFPNRDGSKPDQGQATGVALMDARSIAATAARGGALTSAADIDYEEKALPYQFEGEIYRKRVYRGVGNPLSAESLRMGPNITPWPKAYPMAEGMIMILAAVIQDAVTTTDELIPSGETSSYRSNPLKLAEFTLSRRVPSYVGDAKRIAELEALRRTGDIDSLRLQAELKRLKAAAIDWEKTSIGSAIFARKPGDGSAREQAASCQRVLGGNANLAIEYATKRYRSNCINWGLVPFLISSASFDYATGDIVWVESIREKLEKCERTFPARVYRADGFDDIELRIGELTVEEKEILLSGSLMNFYAKRIATQRTDRK